MFQRAIVRPPTDNFADGLTTVDLGVPDFSKALEEHARYCEALERCGLLVTRLSLDARYPDATFVEDTASDTPYEPYAPDVERPGRQIFVESTDGRRVGKILAVRHRTNESEAAEAAGEE